VRSAAGWIVFLLTFLTIYGGMHAYIFWRARAAFRFGLPVGLALALVMAVMIATMIVGRMIEGAGHVSLANVIQRAGHIWLGLVFLFFVWAVLADVVSLLVRLQGLWLAGGTLFGPVSPRIRFYLPLALALGMNVYGYFEAKSIRVERHLVTTSKLPPGRDRLRLVQVSDLHLGASVGAARLRRIVDLVKQAGPDLLVSTGDLVDSSNGWSRGEAEMWREIEAPLGKYAVTGNHEAYAGLKRAVEETTRSGFRLLKGEAVTVGEALTLAGVDDPAIDGYAAGSAREAELLGGLSRERYVVLLKHRPVIDPGSVGRFDLQLSGHAHKGQIWPFTYVTRRYYIKDAGWLDLGKGSRLYVSRGTGFWGPPIRVLAPPEITVFDLIRGPEAKERE